MRFILEGGWSMLVVILFGAITLVSAVLFALRADARKLGIIRAMTWSTVFTAVGGMLTNFESVMMHVPENPEWAHSPDMHLIVMGGLGEVVTTGIMAFSLLGLAWLVVAVGTRRLQDRDL